MTRGRRYGAGWTIAASWVVIIAAGIAIALVVTR